MGADSATELPLLAIEGDPDAVDTIAFSLDGGLVASGSGPNMVKLWDYLKENLFKEAEPASSQKFPQMARERRLVIALDYGTSFTSQHPHPGTVAKTDHSKSCGICFDRYDNRQLP